VTHAPAVARRSERGTPVRLALFISATVHLAAALAIVFYRRTIPERPPVYRIELIGAAGLKRQMGIVADQQPDVTTPEAPAPKAAERPPEPVKPPPPAKTPAKPVPKPPPKATANATKAKDVGAKTVAKTPSKAALPVAGSGQKTGKGTDVTNMVADGIAFPYQGYLNNIIRQITLNFSVRGSALVAEVKFLIHRDGSVSDIQILTRSGSASFDREARGAIEAAGNSGLFGPLPSGFPDDVLPVFFTFAPEKSNPGA
jgi:protein TonB